jgi:hypothetical protein
MVKVIKVLNLIFYMNKDRAEEKNGCSFGTCAQYIFDKFQNLKKF